MAAYREAEHGYVIRIADGAVIPNDQGNRDRVEYDSWLAGGNSPDPYVAPELSEVLPTVAMVAQARLVIDGDEVSGIETAVGFGAAMAVEGNIFWIFFTVPQPDEDFIAFVQARGNGGGRVNADVTDANTDYIEVTTSDAAGDPAIPVSLALSVQRAQ